jgi:hypothetical protein
MTSCLVFIVMQNGVICFSYTNRFIRRMSRFNLAATEPETCDLRGGGTGLRIFVSG